MSVYFNELSTEERAFLKDLFTILDLHKAKIWGEDIKIKVGDNQNYVGFTADGFITLLKQIIISKGEL